MRVTATVIGCVVALALVIGLGVGVWHLGWFITKADTNKQSEIYNDSFQRQNALTAEVVTSASKIAEVDVQIASNADVDVKTTLTAQRKAMVTQACSQAAKLSDTVSRPPSVDTFIQKEC